MLISTGPWLAFGSFLPCIMLGSYLKRFLIPHVVISSETWPVHNSWEAGNPRVAATWQGRVPSQQSAQRHPSTLFSACSPLTDRSVAAHSASLDQNCVITLGNLMWMVRFQVLKATSMKMSSGMCTVSLVEFTDVSEMLTASHVTLTSCSRLVIKLLGYEALC
jgi:hypothetical protein